MADKVVANGDSTPPKETPSSPPSSNQENGSNSSVTGVDEANNSVEPSPADEEAEVDVIFLDPLDEKFQCPVCQQVLQIPMQFQDCGHRCCSSCLQELLNSDFAVCPLDQMPIARERTYEDKAFRRQTESLPVLCSYSANSGCTWTGVLSEVAGHILTCTHKQIICRLNCGLMFEKQYQEKHEAEDCPKRIINCQFCEIKLFAENETEHLEMTCPQFPIPCPNNCKKKTVIRLQLMEHLEKECARQKHDCQFSPFGCPFIGTRKKMKEHMIEECAVHSGFLCEVMKQRCTTLDSQLLRSDTQKKTILEMDDRLYAMEKVTGPQLIWRIENYSDRLNDAKSGKQTTLFSPSFITNRHGYRLTCSVCLHGDGKARGQYMSLFMCVCRGEYDALLQWPFCHRITFTLIDQCDDPDNRQNIIYSLKPNTCKENKPFLGRPTTERNASFGNQKFVLLEKVQTLDYVRDDRMYIKVAVETDDMFLL